MKRSCLIYGAGGHARVVMDALQANGCEVTAFLDDRPVTDAIHGIPVRSFDPDTDKEAEIIIGIGNNGIREKIASQVRNISAAIIHPSAVVAEDVSIGAGTVILAHAVIQIGARIGKHVIINAGVCIDHDAVIEDYVHIYPNSYIGGAALVRAGVTLDPGSIVARQTIVDSGR